ncbi:MAG: VOC family protein [Exilibacterium sp.]
MGAISLTHIALHVPDVDKCADFYVDFCGMKETLRHGTQEKPVLWLASPGREGEFVIVLIGGGPGDSPLAAGYSHLGFALDSALAVDEMAAKAAAEGCLLWLPREDPWPASYYCGVVDPAGNQVEFSYGQPLGAGSEGPTTLR